MWYDAFMTKLSFEMICGKCGKKPERNADLSNENWDVVDNKPCKSCGGNLVPNVVF